MDVILWIVLALLCAFAAVILIRTARFKPKAGPEVSEEVIDFDRDRAVANLQALVRCRTISNRDPAQEDDGEFEKLIALLPELYPNVFRVCEFRRMQDRGLLFRWTGREPGDPAVMMSHYDVVPVHEEGLGEAAL